MAGRDFNPWDLLVQLESDLRHNTEGAMRAMMFHPGVDMYETDDALVVKMELAGVQAENLNIAISSDDRTVTVSGRRSERQQDRNRRLRCFQLEIYYGEFHREITLPNDIAIQREQITAHYRDGFLVIEMRKRTGEAAERRIIEVTSE